MIFSVPAFAMLPLECLSVLVIKKVIIRCIGRKSQMFRKGILPEPMEASGEAAIATAQFLMVEYGDEVRPQVQLIQQEVKRVTTMADS
jgi:hypothetical protein